MKKKNYIDDELILHEEAKKVIRDLDIIGIIRNYFGEYMFIGSFYSHTMVWEDIDICINYPQDAGTAFHSMICDFMKKDNVYKIVYKNEFMGVNDCKNAYYVGIHYFDEATKRKWKIDIKGVYPEQFEVISNANSRLSSLSQKQRNLILEAKKLVSKEIEGFFRPPKAKSHLIQELVVNNSCINLKEIMECLNNEK